MTYTNPILIVEDEPDGRELVSRMLSVASIPVEMVTNGEEGWARLQQATFCAAIIDLALPGMDGISLLRHIRADDDLADLPCIAVTAYHTPELKQKALAEGFDGYLAKPLDRTMLLSALDGIITP